MSEVAVDADVLMNLVASGEVAGVLAVGGIRLVICPQVEAEVLYLENEVSGLRTVLDLTPLYADLTATRAALTELELERFIAFASEVDDGEAQALAVASVRQIPVATDDRRAIRVAQTLGIVTIDTPQLMLAWADTVAVSMAALALTRVERRARFVPRLGHPLRSRWDQIRADPGRRT